MLPRNKVDELLDRIIDLFDGDVSESGVATLKDIVEDALDDAYGHGEADGIRAGYSACHAHHHPPGESQ